MAGEFSKWRLSSLAGGRKQKTRAWAESVAKQKQKKRGRRILRGKWHKNRRTNVRNKKKCSACG